MAAKEKTSRWAAWLAPIFFLLAAVAAAGPAPALTCGALETRAWEKTSAPLESRQSESLQLLNLHQQNDAADYNDALGSPLAAENAAVPKTLFHYTNEAGLNGILDEEALNPSLKALNPNDVRYGNGQYLSDIVPGTKTPNQLARQFLNQPWNGKYFTHYVEVDVTGLPVVQGRPGVFVVPNETPLDLTGRIVNSGPVTGH